RGWEDPRWQFAVRDWFRTRCDPDRRDVAAAGRLAGRVAVVTGRTAPPGGAGRRFEGSDAPLGSRYHAAAAAVNDPNTGPGEMLAPPRRADGRTNPEGLRGRGGVCRGGSGIRHRAAVFSRSLTRLCTFIRPCIFMRAAAHLI